MAEFEPKLIGFMCNWCSYAGADLAGVSRYQYPPNIRIVRVMCSARVDPVIVAEMFINGADGVFVGGCHLGDCHYIKGNYYAEIRIKTAIKVLEKTGIGRGRLRLEWVSASEGERFSRLMTEFTQQIKELGPSPAGGEKPEPNIIQNLKAAKKILGGSRFRILVGKYYDLVNGVNVYGKNLSASELSALLDEAIESEFARTRILMSTRETPKSVLELSGEMGMEPRQVLEHVVVLRKKNLLALSSIENNSPKFMAAVKGAD